MPAGSCSFADEADSRPQVGGDFEGAGGAAVQAGHAGLAHGVHAGVVALHGCDALGVHAVEEPFGFPPGFGGGVAGDDVQADAESEGAAGVGGQGAHSVDPLGDHVRRLAPHEVDVAVGGGDLFSCGGGPAEVDVGCGVERVCGSPLFHLVVASGEVDGCSGEGAAQHGEEFGGAGVALVVVEEVAVGPLFDRVSPGDDVDEQSVAGDVLEGPHLLGEQGG